ncbi:MAG: ribosome biogenesis GTPase Der [Bauldia sp.]|nr:ribosome biogenesis GTPase Der [Bauldia sp.]MCW5716636.1 ribosome biogenesis GTPase Der [Bauldia sp.]
MADAFEVALIGRPNVGKSTLFNRLVGKRLALVDDTPGVTRDRRKGDGRIGDLEFTVVDTAGLEDADPGSLAGRMRAQTEEAVRNADLTLFMIDARVGVTPADEMFAAILRRTGRPVVLVANKAEGRGGMAGAMEGFELGLGDPVVLSAEHGEGLGDLRQAIEAHMRREPSAGEEGGEAVPAEADEEERDPDRPLQVAIIGRPNAGKSTLINTLIGEDRLLTGPEAGITRDSISIDWERGGRKFRLVDTAGMRRKSKIQEKLEKLSVGDSLRSIQFAEVVVLTIDATQPFDKQDLQLADLVEREGRAIVVALDKWDLVTDQQNRLRELREEADHALPQLGGLAVVAVSGLTGQGIDKLMTAIVKAYDTWNIRVSTAALNKWLERMLQDHPPPATSGRRLKLRYMTQSKARPPTFVAFCSRPEALPESYRRYLVNGLRERFDLAGIPIRLVLRKRDNPFADKD